MTDHALVAAAGDRAPASTPRSMLPAAMALAFAVIAVTGRLRPVVTPDTAGYLAPWAWPELWGGRRTPVLGFLLAPFGDDFTLFPTIVVGLFFAAVYYLNRSLVAFGVSERAALALTLPLPFSNSLLRYSAEVHAEFPSIVLLVYALAELLRLPADRRRALWRYAAFASALGAAYLMRPSLLPFMIVLPALALMLGFVRERKWRFRLAMLLLAVSATPFLLVSSMRYYAVNDFNVVSFGGFTMHLLIAARRRDDGRSRAREPRPRARGARRPRGAGELRSDQPHGHRLRHGAAQLRANGTKLLRYPGPTTSTRSSTRSS